MLRIVQSPSSSLRLKAAFDFLNSFPPHHEIVLVGESRGAVDDLVRKLCLQRPATFGLYRFSIAQIASYLAIPWLAENNQTPATGLAEQAIAARVSFQATDRGALAYLGEVAPLPGFSRSLVKTIKELRAAGISPQDLQRLGVAGSDIGKLLSLFVEALEQSGLCDQKLILEAAADSLLKERVNLPTGIPLLLLDVSVETSARCHLVEALVRRSSVALATIPDGDDHTLGRLRSLSQVTCEHLENKDDFALQRLGRFLFSSENPPETACDDSFSFFSAPGETRECAEIARRILTEASTGTPFDEMAVFLRMAGPYVGVLESALKRAGIPAFFAGGTKRPDQSGRAFLSLINCAVEGLSAKRFAEYLSFGVVPTIREKEVRLEVDNWVPGETGVPGLAVDQPEESSQITNLPGIPDADEQPVLEGTLRAPWRWEELLVEAAVVGGVDRWRRRLDGLAAELQAKLAALKEGEADSSQFRYLQKELGNLEHLKGFCIPIVERLAKLPSTASWGFWLEQLEQLAPLVLKRPLQVLEILAELRPMSVVPHVSLKEVCDVLSQTLASVTEASPKHRYGKVFVGPVELARGRNFAVVFIPGLAEGMFPQRLREDPLLLDSLRNGLGDDLITQNGRGIRERLMLRLAIGAAQRKIYLSFPRLEVVEARPRVPSFYALDLHRAAIGKLPNTGDLERQAEGVGAARLAWPAPAETKLAIDDIEHDLAVLDKLLHQEESSSIRGRARYLFGLNGHLARSLRGRKLRWQAKWSIYDGLCRRTEAIADVLDANRLISRSYSVSALQKYANCPYRFFLSAVHRLEPRRMLVVPEEVEPVVRGHVFHAILAQLARILKQKNMFPISTANYGEAADIADKITDEVATSFEEELKPAIPRVWQDGIEVIRTDIKAWLMNSGDSAAEWLPHWFEWGFGVTKRTVLDPCTVSESAVLAGGFRLHGVIDLVERNSDSTQFRVTDYKSSQNHMPDVLIVGGGEILQPLLYAMSLEAVMNIQVVEGRLFFCTSKGGFSESLINASDPGRRLALRVLETIDSAIQNGIFPPAPKPDGCRLCEFRDVCGPYEEIRIGRKDTPLLANLTKMRGLP